MLSTQTGMRLFLLSTEMAQQLSDSLSPIPTPESSALVLCSPHNCVGVTLTRTNTFIHTHIHTLYDNCMCIADAAMGKMRALF
jgi:hypothetical protein